MMELYGRMATGFIERLRTEEALRVSEERFRLVVENVRDHAILFLGPEGRIADWNVGTERLLGYRAAEVIGGPTDRFFIPEDRASGHPRRELEQAAATGRAVDDNWLVRADGTRFWASGSLTALRDAAGGLRGFVKIFRDRTEWRVAEAAVREGNDRLQMALSAARMGIWTWDVAADMQTRDANLNRLLGLESIETKRPLGEFLERIHPDDREVVAFAFDACARRHRPVNLEFRVIRPDGSVRWLRHQGGFFGEPEGVAPQVAGASVDITDLMETEEALRRAREGLESRVAARTSELAQALHSRSYIATRRATQMAARLANAAIRAASLADSPKAVRTAARLAASTGRAAERALKLILAFDASRSQALERRWIEAIWREVGRALATTEEEQRRRISRELHDQLGQHCASLIIGLTALQAGLPEGSGTVSQLERLVQLASRIDDDLHRIALELRPTALDDVGLHDTLLNLAEEWGERSRVEVDFSSQGLDHRHLPPEVETAVFRIVQEALTNVQKHAAARRVGLILRLRGDGLVVIVEDDGAGFDPEGVVEAAEAAGRLGMRGMRERAALVVGDLEVESAPGEGTTIFVRIPLRPDAGATTHA
jgi:PAS domain S-box-containing protein